MSGELGRSVDSVVGLTHDDMAALDAIAKDVMPGLSVYVAPSGEPTLDIDIRVSLRISTTHRVNEELIASAVDARDVLEHEVRRAAEAVRGTVVAIGMRHAAALLTERAEHEDRSGR